jgi:hypothetical protein
MSDLTLGTSLTSDGNYGKQYTTGMWMSSHFFIPETCKYPDRVLDLVEFLASEAGQTLLFKGIEGVHYTGTSDPYTYNLDEWVKVNGAYGYVDPDRAHYVWFGYLFAGVEYRVDFVNKGWWDAVTSPYDNTGDWASDETKALEAYARGIVSGFVKDVVIQLPSYYATVSLPAEADAIRTKLQEITNRYLTQFVGGQLDIDAGWADYASEYAAAGSDQLQTMLNDAVRAARGN